MNLSKKTIKRYSGYSVKDLSLDLASRVEVLEKEISDIEEKYTILKEAYNALVKKINKKGGD